MPPVLEPIRSVTPDPCRSPGAVSVQSFRSTSSGTSVLTLPPIYHSNHEELGRLKKSLSRLAHADRKSDRRIRKERQLKEQAASAAAAAGPDLGAELEAFSKQARQRGAEQVRREKEERERWLEAVWMSRSAQSKFTSGEQEYDSEEEEGASGVQGNMSDTLDESFSIVLRDGTRTNESGYERVQRKTRLELAKLYSELEGELNPRKAEMEAAQRRQREIEATLKAMEGNDRKLTPQEQAKLDRTALLTALQGELSELEKEEEEAPAQMGACASMSGQGRFHPSPSSLASFKTGASHSLAPQTRTSSPTSPAGAALVAHPLAVSPSPSSMGNELPGPPAPPEEESPAEPQPPPLEDLTFDHEWCSGMGGEIAGHMARKQQEGLDMLRDVYWEALIGSERRAHEAAIAQHPERGVAAGGAPPDAGAK